MTTEELNDKVADACGSGVNLEKCECVTARGYDEKVSASKYCGICDGTGKPTLGMLLSKVDKLNEDIADLECIAADVCEPAKKFLALAWWHTEHAIRELTGRCSFERTPGNSAHQPGRYCACCARYKELKPLAERLRI